MFYGPTKTFLYLSDTITVGVHSHIVEDMDVGRDFQILTFADKAFGKILDPLQTNGLKFSKNICPKRPENEFLAVNLCIIQKIS